MTRTESELRLDTLTRKLDEPASGGEVKVGVIVAVGLTLLVLLQLYLFAPVLTGFAGR